jgi:hypothetical protein
MAITISGSGIVEANIANGAVSSDKLATGIDAIKLADGTITNSELQYINSLSSNAQTQIDGVGGGKVLAMHHEKQTGNFAPTAISGTNNTWTDLDVAITFTPTTTASKFLVYYGFGTSTQDSGTDGGFSSRVKKVQDATTSYPAFLSDYATGNLHSAYYANSQNDTPARWNIYHTVQGVDMDAHTTNSLTYTVQVGQYNITTLHVGNYYAARSQIIVLEVSTT